MWFLATLSGIAFAEDVPDWSGDIALAYGRNWGQELMVGGLVGEVKRNLHPQVAVGGRLGSTLGVGFGLDEGEGLEDPNATAKGYFGVPVLLKAEAFPDDNPNRPFAGLGAGVTFANGGGAVVASDGAAVDSAAYRANGPMFTVMPELGMDIGMFRVSLQHAFLLGSRRDAQDSVVAAGADDPFARIPGLSGTALQAGVHFGGPRDLDDTGTIEPAR